MDTDIRTENIPQRRLRLDVLFSVSLILLVFLFSVIIGFLTYANGLKTVDTLASDIFSQAGAGVRRDLSSFMTVPQSINGMNATVISKGYVRTDDLNTLGRLFLDEALQFPTVKSVEFATETDMDASVARNVFDVPLAIGYSGPQTGYTYTAYQTDEQGNPGKNIWTLPNFRPRDNSWYQTAVRAGKPTWTSIYVWPDGELGIDAVTPVSKNGTLLGVLDTAITLDNISEFLKSTRISANGRIYIIDEQGYLVAGSSVAKPYKPDPTGKGGPTRLSIADVKDPLLTSAQTELTRRFGKFTNIKQESHSDYTEGGVKYYVSATPFRDQYGISWTIVSTAPQSDFTAELYRANTSTVLFIIISIAVASVVALVLAGIITAPLSKLVESVERLGAGETPGRVRSNIREIYALSHALYSMAETIRVQIESLTVGERQAVEKQNQFRSERDKLEAIIQSVGDGVIVLDQYLRIQVINRAALDLTGYITQECVGRQYDSVLKLVYRDRPEMPYDEFVRIAAATGVPRNMPEDLMLIAKDGRMIPVHGSATPLLDTDGNPEGCVIIFREGRGGQP